MKCSPLLPQVALVFAVAYACSDSTAPANSHALVAPTHLSSVLGKPPPPPVATAITITVSPAPKLLTLPSDPVPVFASAPFNGTYFSNGASVESGVAASEVGDPTLTFNGTAWLKLDNKQPTTIGTASANARFKAQDMKFTGMGTLVIQGHTVVITSVEVFIPQPDCGLPGVICAHIEFTATVDDNPGQRGTADAFDRAFCSIIPGEGGPFYYCPGGSP